MIIWTCGSCASAGTASSDNAATSAAPRANLMYTIGNYSLPRRLRLGPENDRKMTVAERFRPHHPGGKLIHRA